MIRFWGYVLNFYRRGNVLCFHDKNNDVFHKFRIFYFKKAECSMARAFFHETQLLIVAITHAPANETKPTNSGRF
jgi:hypothetical protein